MCLLDFALGSLYSLGPWRRKTQTWALIWCCLRGRQDSVHTPGLSDTCVLSVGGSGRGGGVVLPVLLFISTARGGTWGKALGRVRPDRENRQTNKWYTQTDTETQRGKEACTHKTCTRTDTDTDTNTQWKKVRPCLLSHIYITVRARLCSCAAMGATKSMFSQAKQSLSSCFSATERGARALAQGTVSRASEKRKAMMAWEQHRQRQRGRLSSCVRHNVEATTAEMENEKLPHVCLVPRVEWTRATRRRECWSSVTDLPFLSLGELK